MGNLTVAVIGSPGYAGDLGKKGTTSDITFYNLKRGDHTVTFLEPARYPERLSSLFYSVSLATMALVVVDDLSPAFGECVIMLHTAGIKEGYLVTRNYIILPTPDNLTVDGGIPMNQVEGKEVRRRARS